MKLECVTLFCSLALTNPLSIDAMRAARQSAQHHSAGSPSASTYEALPSASPLSEPPSYEESVARPGALFQHRSRVLSLTPELPSTPELEDQPPAYQTPRNPPTYQVAQDKKKLEKDLETLLDYARKGHTQEALRQMQYFKEIHQAKAVGTKPLREALIGGHLETFKYLSRFYNSEDEFRRCIVFKVGGVFLKTALLTKDLDAVEKYLTMSGDCPFTEHLNQIIESEGEQVELLTLLINHKAAVNVDCYETQMVYLDHSPLYSSITESPLLHAVKLEKPNLILVLLKAGANPRRCYDGTYNYSKNLARINLLDENVPISPAIQQLIRENQPHKNCCSMQ